MSWSIQVTGEIKEVWRRVESANVNGQEQGEAARSLILNCLNSVPTNGVEVRASGHQDRWNSTLSIDVKAVTLALEDHTPRTGALSGEGVAA